MDNRHGYTGAALEAYDMGYNEFSGADPMPPSEFDLSPFYSSARYANIIVPTIREMAGYEDSGHGTWQQLTGEAQETAPYVLDELVDAFSHGMYQHNLDMITEGRPIID